MEGLLVFVPVLGAPLLHAPVLTLDLLPALKRPLDGGATVRGRRLLGDNKTWRGALVMAAGVLLATLGLSLWEPWWSGLPEELREAGPLVLGLLVATGTVLGELPNSFVKRQLGVAPGGRANGPAALALSIWDQADFVPVIVLLLLPLWAMPLPAVFAAFAVVVLVHLAINVIGYAIGARETAI